MYERITLQKVWKKYSKEINSRIRNTGRIDINGDSQKFHCKSCDDKICSILKQNYQFGKKKYLNPSLDRVDNKKRYIKIMFVFYNLVHTV